MIEIAQPRSAALDSGSLFPAWSQLPRTVSWRTPVVVALGGAVLVTVSLGPMATELGSVSAFVWLGASLVGGLQAILLGELTSRYPGRAGGTAQFAYRALPRGSPILGAISSWSYWFAWTPGIAVNLLLAASFLKEALSLAVDSTVLAALLGLAIYALNLFGLRSLMRITGMLAAIAVLPLVLVLVAPIAHPSSFSIARTVHLSTSHAGSPVALLFKWFYVAAWSAYGAELSSTMCAETKNCACDARRMMKASAVIFIVAFGSIPLILTGIGGAAGIKGDPTHIFSPAASLVVGHGGAKVVMFLLGVGLLLGAQAFVLSSSRTIYQLALDRHLPSAFAQVNRRGVPTGSLLFDGLAIGVLVLAFGTHFVEIVAAANVGYLLVFILMPLSYLSLQRLDSNDETEHRLSAKWIPVAGALALFNTVVLVVGALEWGLLVTAIGVGFTLAIVPISRLRGNLRHSPT